MNYHIYRFTPPNNRVKRKGNLPTTVSPQRRLHQHQVGRPQFFNGKRFPEEENIPKRPCSLHDWNLQVKNERGNNASEKSENILNSMNEDALADYFFMKDLFPTPRENNMIPGISPTNQCIVSDNCIFNLFDEVNCLDVIEGSTNNVSTIPYTDTINFDLTTVISDKNTEKYLETNTKKEANNLQDKEISNKGYPSETNIRFPISSSDPKTDNLSQPMQEGNNNLLENNYKSVCPIYSKGNALGDKPKSEIADKFIFHSPVRNIIQQNQISANNSFACSNGSSKLLRNIKLGDLESKSHSLSTDTIPEPLRSSRKSPKCPYFAGLSEKKDHKDNWNSSSNENSTFTYAAIDSVTHIAPTGSLSEKSKIFSEECFPALKSNIKSGEQCSNVTIQLEPMDVISNEAWSTKTHESELNFSNEIKKNPAKANNDSIQLNSVNFVSNGENLKEPDFIYSSILESDISLNHMDFSLSSVTNYYLNEPIDFGVLDESFEMDYCTSSVNTTSIPEEQIICDQFKFSTYDNDVYKLLDNIFESDADKYSSDFEDASKTKGKKKNKQKKRKTRKRNREEKNLHPGKLNQNQKTIRNSKKNETKSYSDGATQTLKPEPDDLVVRCINHDAQTQTLQLLEPDALVVRFIKHDAQTQWNSSDINCHATVNSIDQYKSKPRKNQYSSFSYNDCQNQIHIVLDDQNKGLGSGQQPCNLEETESIVNTKEKLIDNSTTDTKKVSNNLGIYKRRVANNSTTNTKSDNSTPGLKGKRNNFREGQNVSFQSNSHNSRKRENNTKLNNNITVKNTFKATNRRTQVYKEPSFNSNDFVYDLREAKGKANGAITQVENRKIKKSGKNRFQDCKKTSSYQAKTSTVLQRQNLKREEEQLLDSHNKTSYAGPKNSKLRRVTGETCPRKKRKSS